ncbi:DUF3558 domain-containing protein [Actinomadura rubrisoli]|uniref:DUF3558 domain-containing protein n=1 Tax=Actinomadura rubrisoli TaxID=2530368 RepID=A0A4R5AI64_9ACTN|nr:DUF3558 domain-containing protein [Actinomadura rubrisoli]TDD69792.1 DUF3558 domain-containing protein [Actinomadura rubrisoli]
MSPTGPGPFTANPVERVSASAVALVMMLAAVVGCGTDDDRPPAKASGTRTPSAGSSAATPASSPSAAARTLAELVEHPCRAIDPKDAGPGDLGIFIEGREEDLQNNPKSCEWGARGGMVSFTPYPSTDMTKDKRFQNLTAEEISGHRALLGTPTSRGKGMCIAFVSVGSGQSFRLMVSPFGGNAPGPAAPVLATNFAMAILSHLS